MAAWRRCITGNRKRFRQREPDHTIMETQREMSFDDGFSGPDDEGC